MEVADDELDTEQEEEDAVQAELLQAVKMKKEEAPPLKLYVGAKGGGRCGSKA